MHPTGIAMDDQGYLYVNEWYMVPGELDEGSSTAAGSASKAGGTGKRRSLQVHLNAGSAGGGTGNGAGSGGGGSGSTGSQKAESEIDWGHEPQYLHNVRMISLADVSVLTIAGSYIRKFQQPFSSVST